MLVTYYTYTDIHVLWRGGREGGGGGGVIICHFHVTEGLQDGDDVSVWPPDAHGLHPCIQELVLKHNLPDECIALIISAVLHMLTGCTSIQCKRLVLPIIIMLLCPMLF